MLDQIKSGLGRTGLLACLFLVPTLMAWPASALASSIEMGLALEKSLTLSMTASGAPGGLAGVWTDDISWSAARGLANVDTQTPIGSTDVWRIGSVTKTFTATAVLRLADKGLLSLDDKLSKYRPDFPKADQISVRQLLQHTSGIFSWDEDDATREAIVNDPDRGWTMETMIELAAQKPFYFEPGQGYHYSNVGYFLLVPVIEQASGKSVAQVIADEITTPLGLKHTYMPESLNYPDQTIHGYQKKDGALQDLTGTGLARVINFDLAHTAGGMVSTVDDLKIWARALATGQLLSPAMHQEQMHTVSSSSTSDAGYGLGVVTFDGWLGHSGGVAGSMCNMYINPTENRIIIHFFNMLNPVDLQENEADTGALANVLLDMIRITGSQPQRTTR